MVLLSAVSGGVGSVVVTGWSGWSDNGMLSCFPSLVSAVSIIGFSPWEVTHVSMVEVINVFMSVTL